MNAVNQTIKSIAQILIFFKILGAKIIISNSFAQAQEVCPLQQNKNLIELINLSKNILETHDDMIELYQTALKCPERIWNTSNTKLGSIPTYFYRVSDNTLCMLPNKNAVCVQRNELLEEESVKQALADDFAGYAIRFDQKNIQEYLILNRSIKDFESRSKSKSIQLVNELNSRVRKCARYANNQTIQPKLFNLQRAYNRSNVAGFCAHEHFHLFQRKWPGLKLNAQLWYDEKLRDKKYQEKIELLRERLTYHLQAYIDLRLSRKSEESPKHLVLLKGYYEELKNSFPQAFINLNDKYEGVAQYITERTEVIYRLGCNIKEDDLIKAVASNLADVASSQASFRDTPYTINALASLALDMNGKINWKNVVETSTQTPLDILLEQVPRPTKKQLDLDRLNAEALARCIAE